MIPLPKTKLVLDEDEDEGKPEDAGSEGTKDKCVSERRQGA